MENSPALLRVKRLIKRFGEMTVLKDVSFDLRAGEVHALCGENGAGKSTLIKCLSGVWPHGSYEGRIEVGGEEVRFGGIHEAEEAGVAVIHQELALAPEMTVAENIYLGSEPTRRGLIDWGVVYAGTEAMLREYGLDLDPAATVSSLGVGRQQLVEILKALSKKARILLLDEPTAALTDTEVEVLIRIVRDLRARGVGCVYISHRLDEVFALSDRITVLRDGETTGTLTTSSTDRNEVIRRMVGREIKDYYPRHPSRKGDVLLKVERLTVGGEEKGRQVAKEVDFEVRAGEVLGIGGLMGAGRTELLMHLFAGVGKRLGGNVFLRGNAHLPSPPAVSIGKGLMMVTEDRKREGLVLDQSIGFNLSLASLAQFTCRGLLDEGAEFRRNQRFFDSLGVKAPNQEMAVGRLSGGNQQKVVLGKALMTEPWVILLDEPTRGVDVGAKVDVYELINRLTYDGKAVVMVSSELPELMGMSDRILILSEGRSGGLFDRDEATPEKLMKAAMAHHARRITEKQT
ncbi:MAG: sugar ABC transporter ATP-binding protein [Verrucomicrobiae bacterium]|nr:sugar ABC transporter ATP-binding protein [Verrucomicrobiae bacterium]